MIGYQSSKALMVISMIGAMLSPNNSSKRIRAQLHAKFGKMGYAAPARFSLTLPPWHPPVTRTPEVKARKKSLRQAKRLRINTKGWN